MTARDSARPAESPVALPLTSRRPALLFAASIGAALVTLWSARNFFHDDAFITFRYVERLWSGHGLSWTSGPPVEGFTHPLWLALLALLRPLPLSLQQIARGMGLLSLVGLFGVWRRAKLAPEFLLALVSFPGLVLWTLGGSKRRCSACCFSSASSRSDACLRRAEARIGRPLS
jgi:hypothetical protein